MIPEDTELLRAQIRDFNPELFRTNTDAELALKQLRPFVLEELVGVLAVAQTGTEGLAVLSRIAVSEGNDVSLRRVTPNGRLVVEKPEEWMRPFLVYTGEQYDMTLTVPNDGTRVRIKRAAPLGEQFREQWGKVNLTKWSDRYPLLVQAKRRLGYTNVCGDYYGVERLLQAPEQTPLRLKSVSLDEGRKTGSSARSHEPGDDVYIPVAGEKGSFTYNGDRRVEALSLDNTLLPLRRVAEGLNLSVRRTIQDGRMSVERRFEATSPNQKRAEDSLAFSVSIEAVIPIPDAPFVRSDLEHLDVGLFDRVSVALFGLLPS